MESISFQNNEWLWCSDDLIAKPLWFECDQLPPECWKPMKWRKSLTGVKRAKQSKCSKKQLGKKVSEPASSSSDSDVVDDPTNHIKQVTLTDLLYDADNEIDIELKTAVLSDVSKSDWEVSDF